MRDQHVAGDVDRDERDDGVPLFRNDGDAGEEVDGLAPDSLGELVRGHRNPQTEQLDQGVQRRPRLQSPACDVRRSRIVGEAGGAPDRLAEPGLAIAGLAQGIADLGHEGGSDVSPGHDLTVGILPVAFKA